MRYTDFLDENEVRTYAQLLNARAKALGKKQKLLIVHLRDRIYASGGRCEWCSSSLLGRDFEIDHIISLYQGGKHHAENLAVACPECNRSKATKHPVRFAQETLARTGVRTALIERLLAEHGLDGLIQHSLFDSPLDSLLPNLAEEESDDEPPPYIWK